MSYLDGIISGSFKPDIEGRTIFYPWGVFGSGVIIDSEDALTKLKKFLKRIYVVLLVAIIAIGVTAGFWVNLALLPVFCIWYFFTMKRLTKDLQKTTEKLRFSESYKNSARSHNLATLIVLEVFSILFVAGGVFILYQGNDQIMALLSIVFFGLCGVVLGYMIAVKYQQRRQNS